MPIGVVETLQRKARDGFIKLPRRPVIGHGDLVRVLHGHFVGLTGIFDGQSSHERQRILLDLLGQQVAVEMPPGSVEAVIHR